jgi:amino acid transporter
VELAIGSSVVRLLGYIICIAALPVIRRNANDAALERSWRLRGGYTIPVIALVICLWLVAQSKIDDWISVAILLVIGLGLYAIEKWYYSRK